MKRLAFLCVHNAGRSQMAAGFARHYGGSAVAVMTGGSDPAGAVNPVAVAAMAEIGIDISEARPRRWDPDELRAAHAVVTMGCGDECPVFSGIRYLDWDLEDPDGQPIEVVRRIRDEIERSVVDLLAEAGVTAEQ